MIELAINTITADNSIGSQSAARNCIGSLFPSSRMDELGARLSFSEQRVKGDANWGAKRRPNVADDAARNKGFQEYLPGGRLYKSAARPIWDRGGKLREG
jgi:hypothetical protein